MTEPASKIVPESRPRSRLGRMLRSSFRWLFRFSLRRMLLAVAAIAVVFGIWAGILESYARERRAAAEIARLCDGSELVDDLDPDRDGWTSADGTFRVEFLQDCHELPLATLLAYRAAYAIPGGRYLCPPRALDFPWSVSIFDNMRSDRTDRVATVPLPAVLGELSKMPSLRSLEIASDSFTDGDFEFFLQFKQLKFVHVRSSAISPKCIDSVAALPNLTYAGLDFAYAGLLDMERCEELLTSADDAPPLPVTNLGFKKLAALKKLELLAICYAPIGEEDASALAAMPLNGLYLQNVAITDASFRAICANPAIRTLGLFDLYDTMLTRERLEIVAEVHRGAIEIYWPSSVPGTLAPFLGHTAIGQFDINLGGLDETDMSVLLQNTGDPLRLNKTPISAGQMARLKAKYPTGWVSGGIIAAPPEADEDERKEEEDAETMPGEQDKAAAKEAASEPETP